MKLYELLEARRNSEHSSQQKVSTFDQLYEYALNNSNKKYHVTFTQLEKVGVNPKSIHNETPNAVYTYPLYSPIIKSQFEGSSTDDLSYIFPYANNTKYVNILVQLKPLMDVSKYTDEHFQNDVKKMGIPKDELISKFGQDLAYAEHPFEKLWIVTQDDNTNKWSKNLLNIGYNGFSDVTGMGLIYKAEPIQAFFLKPDAYKVVDRFNNDQERME